MGRFLGVLVLATLVVGVIAVAIGFYQGWFTPVSHTDPSDKGKVTYAVEVDTGKIKSDTEKAREQVGKASDAVKDKIQDLAGSTTVQGKVTNVNETDRSLTLMTAEGKEVIVQLAPKAEVRLKDKDGELRDLHPGDQVTVVYKSEDGKNLARSITASQG